MGESFWFAVPSILHGLSTYRSCVTTRVIYIVYLKPVIERVSTSIFFFILAWYINLYIHIITSQEFDIFGST